MSDKNNCCSLNNSSEKNCNILHLVIIFLLLVIAGLGYLLFNNNSNNTTYNNGTGNIISTGVIINKTNTGIISNNIEIKIIGDKRCLECSGPTAGLIKTLKEVPFLTGAKLEEMDFSNEEAKKIVKENGIEFLPAILVNTDNISDQEFKKFLKKTPSGLFSLQIGAQYDPYQEICDNKIDDNNDGTIDCKDTKCSKDIVCAPKVDRPVADLYIMSYCPYGLQAQKGYLEVMSKLSKVADVNIKFVPYIMHGQKEADENVVQYCIQKEQKEKYIPYLNCFLKKEGQEAICKKEAKIDEKKLSTCITNTKKEFNVDINMADKTKQYPIFSLNEKEAKLSGVEGSPTFVLNGIKIEKMGRNAKGYAEAICSTFKVKPKECNEKFQEINFDPMFGFTSNGTNATSGCGQ